MTLASGFAPPDSTRPDLDGGAERRTALGIEALEWRVLVDPPAPGPRNMAADHALATCSSPGEAVLRIYRWSRPTVSFGRNEPARDRYDPSAGRNAGIEFVRRPTGGRAVLHDQELTYSVIVPLETREGLRATGLRTMYGLINRGLVEALSSLGVPATMAEGRRPPAALESGTCFDEPAPGEVTVAGRKLVGSAQARLEGAILQHGSLLIGPGQERLVALGSTSTGFLPGRDRGEADESGQVKAAVSLEEILGHAPSWYDLVEAVVSGLSGVTGGDWHRGELREP